MKNSLSRLVVALLPICFLSAQQTTTQDPQLPNHPVFHEPSPEALRHAAELRQRMRDHAIAINDVAGQIHSPDDARKLVNLVAAEFSDELPPQWATHSLRERIARAEYESAADPGSLIPEQQVANAWDDFVEKIGAPPETMLNAAEIHYLRDAHYTSARFFWARGDQQIWTIPGVFALGPGGKVANGSRAVEAIRLLWLLANLTDADYFSSIHTEVQKGIMFSDLIAHPEKPPAPGTGKGYVTARAVSYPVQQAAFRYFRDRGAGAMNRAIEGLLKELLAD